MNTALIDSKRAEAPNPEVQCALVAQALGRPLTTAERREVYARRLPFTRVLRVVDADGGQRRPRWR